ncbi:sensor histidine kinase [Roseivirga echinicomitans]|uniref:histidine kinase n=1 Tax=Roseivirga echinicomitans TaxID=296218 RepID=A0A150XDC2_9BACT|nr:HAMP domain-containing sensor histidine kinase [Roseivirga echinicomitans]KYG76725.1 alkaline phosphatase [Roseivirga echinicomitans]
MLFNSKAVALLLAFVVGLITTAFLSLVSEVPVQALIIGGLISFAATYIFTYVTFEFLVFKEISKIYEVLNKIRKKNFSFIEEEEERKHLNPLKRINQEIFTYAMGRQREIEELKKVETFRREFLADVSHELKTPVFAAQGFVHTLLDGAIDDSTVRIKFLKRAAKSLDSLDALIHDLLTLSQIELGETKMHFEHFDILEMASEVLDQFENKVERKGLYIGFDQEYNHPIFVYADSEKIYRVLTNLVSNANKYTDEGEIILGFSVSSGHVTVSVRDTGMGIPPEDLSRVFERFFRVEKSRSKGRKGGTGLGLAIVKHIMEAHNSKVSVISTFGKGSTFSFKLPLSKEEDLDSTEDDEFESED